MTESASQTPAQVSRQELRRKLRDMRQDIASRQRVCLDQAIRQHLLRLVESRAASTLAAYWPFDGEPDMIPLCKQLFDKGVKIALPRIAETGNSMEFHAWRPGLILEQNRFGIYEPGKTEKRTLSDFAILIMPLVGYDRLGNRLGMGSGYYDRHLKSKRDSPTPLRVGIAYSLQERELISPGNRDIPLHGVVNENGWFTFGQ
jgi:5-formyltetrahydrofolate cyclo-ligase